MGKKKEEPFNLDQAKQEVKEKQKENTEMKNTSIKKAVIVSIIVTAIVTAGVIYGGVKLRGYIYNQGVNAERSRQAAVIEQAAKLSTELKPQQ